MRKQWLLGLIPIAHELGHIFLYNVTYFPFRAWIEFSLMGMCVMYPFLYPCWQPLVFAGGLLFTFPFYKCCDGWLSYSVYGGFVLYGLIETVWGLLL